MMQGANVEQPREQSTAREAGSSVATHRRGERIRTFSYRPRGEARM